MSFFRVVLLAGVVFLSWMGVASAESRPNVLLIMADDLGVECLGSYGGTSYPTPNLDALAASGTRFTHAYSTPKCSPSRVNLLTGRYGFRTGEEWGVLPAGEITFGNIVQAAGVKTAVAGKWQMSLLKENPNHPHESGFDAYSLWAWHEGPRYWQPMIWQNGRLLHEEIADRYGPDLYTAFLIDFMREHREGPFLAYYPMCLTHFPKTNGPYVEPPGPDGKHQTFAEMVAQMDRLIGELVRALEELGLRENTLILFTADNGSPNKVVSVRDGKEVKGGKAKHTNGGTHVPLIASWPGTTPAGAVSEDLIDFSDFLPTFAELFGAKLPADRPIDGRSFALQLKGQAGNPRAWAFTEFEGLGWIRNQGWKLYTDGRFFDMASDPEEASPLEASGLAGDAAAAHAFLKKELVNLRGE